MNIDHRMSVNLTLFHAVLAYLFKNFDGFYTVRSNICDEDQNSIVTRLCNYFSLF